jgi:hypothetical protein
MGWRLKSGKHDVKWEGGKVFGRGDFPNLTLFSRQHFEIFEKDGRMFVQDLGSTNGTRLGGKALPPKIPSEIKQGDEISIGSTILVFGDENSIFHEPKPEKKPEPQVPTAPLKRKKKKRGKIFIQINSLRLDVSILIALLVAIFLEPSLHFGLAVGLSGIFVISSIFVISFFLAATITGFGFKKYRISSTLKTRAVYIALVSLFSLGLNHALMISAHLEFGIMADLVQAKVEYFCFTNYTHDQCVRQINLCSECAAKVDRWKRDLIVARLKEERKKTSQNNPQRIPAAYDK